MYSPGTGLALANIGFWIRKPKPKPEPERIAVLQAADVVDELLYSDEELIKEMSQDTGPVKHVHETLANSLYSYEGKKKRLEQDLARIKEELRQTDVTIRALSQAYNILGTDIASTGEITFEGL